MSRRTSFGTAVVVASEDASGSKWSPDGEHARPEGDAHEGDDLLACQRCGKGLVRADDDESLTCPSCPPDGAGDPGDAADAPDRS